MDFNDKCFNFIYLLSCLKVFLEQKKMLKSGLNIAHFRQYVSIIEKETKEYFESWGESGEKSKQNVLYLSFYFHFTVNMSCV